MSGVKFNDADCMILTQVIGRWRSLCAREGNEIDVKSARMDMEAANGVNGNEPLDYGKLMDFDDADFVHDMAGIARHMDRATGQLMNHFVPRCVE